MALSPLAYADSLRIGSVDFVSPDEIKVLLDTEAPDSVALNTGTPRPFPRINSYLLIPSDQGHLVGQVEWITVEHSQYPKRKGMQDFGLVDLPYPLRKMSLNILGCLVQEGTRGIARFAFRRGVEAYPTVGDPVLLPTEAQVRAIIESGTRRRVVIGTSPLASNAEVAVDPDRLFGRHLAVLGNTGSGKSCSVAGLIRWSLNAAKKSRGGKEPNARFIVLDPNGEYARTFRDLSTVRTFSVTPKEGGDMRQLEVPLWFWNTVEWAAFTQASAKTQRPTLVQALRTVRDGGGEPTVTPSHDMRRYLRTLVSALLIDRNSGTPWKAFPHSKNFVARLTVWLGGLEASDAFAPEESAALEAFRNKVTELVDARTPTQQNRYPQYEVARPEVDELLTLASAAHSAFGGSEADTLPVDADAPRPFTGDQFLRSIEANAELANVSEHVETMLMRVRSLLSDSRMKAIAVDKSDISLDGWLKDYIGDDKASNGTITVIDLSLVPAELVHTVTAVIARIVLEALQRYRQMNNGTTLPTVLVMEEAHTFIHRYKEDAEVYSSAAMCCHVFEKIAREGRKFGLGLVLSSQRPSELSATVLSQCNTYLLHRISNDKDQELVSKLVPDNLRGLLRDLPSLPSRYAILLGWASELPVLVQLSELPEAQRPRSDDPDFWAVWSGKGPDEKGAEVEVERAVDWKALADEWQKTTAKDEGSEDSQGETPAQPDASDLA